MFSDNLSSRFAQMKFSIAIDCSFSVDFATTSLKPLVVLWYPTNEFSAQLRNSKLVEFTAWNWKRQTEIEWKRIKIRKSSHIQTENERCSLIKRTGFKSSFKSFGVSWRSANVREELFRSRLYNRHNNRYKLVSFSFFSKLLRSILMDGDVSFESFKGLA